MVSLIGASFTLGCLGKELVDGDAVMRLDIQIECTIGGSHGKPLVLEYCMSVEGTYGREELRRKIVRLEQRRTWMEAGNDGVENHI